MAKKVKKWNGPVPKKCDLCGLPFADDTFIDGKTIYGPWAILCTSCLETKGVGIGEGRGQKYSLSTLEKTGG